jgi:hypothetical protein
VTDQPPLLTEANFLALVQRVQLLEQLALEDARAHVTLTTVLNAMIDKMALALVGFNREKVKQDLHRVWEFWRRVKLAGGVELPPDAQRLNDTDTEGSA